jgi:hypothetical protein
MSDRSPNKLSPTTGSPRRGPFVMKIVRRIHLYAGLLLMPWLLLFGITALSFNHPTVGRGLEGKMLPPERIESLTGVKPWDAAELAEQVALKLDSAEGAFEMQPGSAHFQGWPLLSRRAPGGREVVIVGLDSGRVILTKRESPHESKRPPFLDHVVKIEGRDMAALAQDLSRLHEELNISVEGPLMPHPEVHPELRFVARDSGGTAWNIVYNLTTGAVDGRPSAEKRHAPIVELLESLHKQHHFPANFGPTFFWALFSDLTAFTLILWSITGMAMWIQMKKLRAIGVIVLVTGATIFGLVVMGTSAELSFGPERAGP